MFTCWWDLHSPYNRVSFVSGACCSVLCGRSGCSLCASSTHETMRSRKSQRWCTPSSVSCSTMPSNMSGAAGVSGWTPCPSPIPRSEHSLYSCTPHTHKHTHIKTNAHRLGAALSQCVNLPAIVSFCTSPRLYRSVVNTEHTRYFSSCSDVSLNIHHLTIM